jgi:hypothetical protein
MALKQATTALSNYTESFIKNWQNPKCPYNRKYDKKREIYYGGLEG